MNPADDCLRFLYDCLTSSNDSLIRLLAFRSLVGLAAEIGCSGTRFGEESGEDRLEDGSEDALTAIGHGKCHPEDEDEFESVVERWWTVSM